MSEKRQIRENPTFWRSVQDFVVELWRLVESTIALAAVYSLVVEIINHLAILFSKELNELSPATIDHMTPVLKPLINIDVPLPDPLAEWFIVCIVTAVVLYYVLKWVCGYEWVKEKVQIKECWEEVRWYNPFSWVKAIVCTFKEVLKWVLKWICKYVLVPVIGYLITCIVVGLVIAL